jgi:hypothetical protein
MRPAYYADAVIGGRTVAGQGARGHLKWTGLIVLSIVPVAAAALVVQLLGPVGYPLRDADLAVLRPGPYRDTFLPGLLTLAAVLTAHLCVCLIGIYAAWDSVRKSRRDLELLGEGVVLALAVILLVLGLALFEVEIFRLTYGFFAAVYSQAEYALPAPGMLKPGAMEAVMLLPTCLGILGTAVISAAAVAQVRRIPASPRLPNKFYELRLKRAQARLKRFLYILSLGLVVSTIAVSIFFSLPERLPACRAAAAPAAAPAATAPAPAAPGPAVAAPAPAAPAPAPAAPVASPAAASPAAPSLAAAPGPPRPRDAKEICGRIKDYASEMTTFWGAVLSLALFFCGGVPLILMQAKVRSYMERSASQTDIDEAEKRLVSTGLLSDGRDQVKVVLTILAPLATGPAAKLIDQLSGG